LSYETVIWDESDGVGRLTLNRPETLNAWTANAGALRSYAADPLTPAIEFAEHHPLQLGAARDAAFEYVLGRGRSPRLIGGDLQSFPLTAGSG